MLTHIETLCVTDTGDPQRRDGWHTVYLSSLEEMPAVIKAVTGGMTQLSYPLKDRFGVHLALQEAISNAIKHGHQNDPGKRVEVRYRISQEHVLVEVEDQGPGFISCLVPDSTQKELLERCSGRGLRLIRHYVTWVRFNTCGNCVTFCQCPSRPLDADPA